MTNVLYELRLACPRGFILKRATIFLPQYLNSYLKQAHTSDYSDHAMLKDVDCLVAVGLQLKILQAHIRFMLGIKQPVDLAKIPCLSIRNTIAISASV